MAKVHNEYYNINIYYDILITPNVEPTFKI